ncbi:MAG: hypothetical protein PHV68_06385 [Candidatus Gastranaerophilales bacterium]|nr:hypothetical protein [Candidatus Gastranaerophilales bacterium]
MSKSTEHFEEKYPHTAIKHKLLSSCLETCLDNEIKLAEHKNIFEKK